MVVNFTSQFIKYLVYGLIVNLLFSYIPQKQLPKSDIILMISIIILSFIFLDFLSPSYENFDTKNNNNIIENLDTTTDEIENEDTENEDNNDVEFIISNKPENLKN